MTPALVRAIAALAAPFGVDRRQLALLVQLFGTLGERKEVTGALGTDRQAMQLTAMGLLVPGVLMCLLALGSMPLGEYDLITLGISAMLLLVMLVVEAANSFLNPAEAAVLAHQPIAGGTYFTAKLTYLLVIVLRLELPVSGPPALAGLLKPEARWFYPLTHFGAACLAGVFVALVACALFGLLFRVVPTSRLRNAALWMQLAVTLSPLAFNLARPTRRALAAAPWLAHVDLSYLPIAWFSALGVIGQAPSAIPLRWPAAAGAAVSVALIAYGIRSLSAGYLSRIAGVLRASRGRRRARRSIAGRLAGALTGHPAGRAAFGFLSAMMRRDWQFRRAMAQSLLALIIYIPIIVRSLRGPSPFAGATPSAIGLAPEILSLVTFMACMVLAYSDQYRASWVFLLAPRDGVRAFVRGVYWALWLPLAAAPLLLTFPAFAWRWGVADAALFTAYGLAVTALLLAPQLFVIEGLPFGCPPRAERTHMMLPTILFGPIVLLIGWVLQWHFLFRSRALTALAAVLFASGAGLVARPSLRRLAQRADRSLARLAGGSSGMVEVPGE
jgi:hypothetical protein